jgi:hypothetical protein
MRQRLRPVLPRNIKCVGSIQAASRAAVVSIAPIPVVQLALWVLPRVVAARPVAAAVLVAANRVVAALLAATLLTAAP